MERLFIECAIRAALLVAGTAILLLLLRVKDAAAHHNVWTGVVVAMLLLPAWTAWGPKATVRVLPPLPEKIAIVATAPAIRGAAPEFTQMETNIPPSPVPAPRPRWTWQAIMAGAYLLGVVALLSRMAIGLVHARRLVRRAKVRDERLTNAASFMYPGLQVQTGPVAAPVTVGWFRPRVILPEEWRDWPQAKLDAVLLHEGEHARRRDPLIQGLALLNRAVFWFHPAAWWLEHRIATLAEEACDDFVLARGHSPSDYSEYLMDMARAISRSGSRIHIAGVAMPGTSLPHRIKRIIEGAPVVRISRKRMALMAAACCIACAAFAAGDLDHVAQGVPVRPLLQSGGLLPPGLGLPAFESVTIKPGSGMNRIFTRKKGLLTATNITLRGLIRWAYPLRAAQGQVISGTPDISDFLLDGPKGASITGAPGWLDSQRFSVEAMAPGNPDAEQARLMLRSLLADRFKLDVHFETRMVPVYALEVSEAGKHGSQLRPHVTDGSCWDPAADQPSPSVTGIPTLPFCGGFRIIGPNNSIPENRRGVPMAGVAAYLTGRLDRPVLDRTGLSGSYDFDLVIEHKPTSDYSKLFGAVQQQLGLRLVPTNGPIEIFVIDHVEQPSVDSSAQAQASPPNVATSQQFVDAVIFDGNRRIGSQELSSRIFLRPGDRYNDQIARADYMALWNSKFFDEIRLEVKDSPNRANGMIVVFHLKERPTIAYLDYVGFTSVTEQEILERFRQEQLNLTVESLLDVTKVRQAEDVLKALLAEHGHPSPVVKGGVATIPASNRVRLTFTASEGPGSGGTITPQARQSVLAAPAQASAGQTNRPTFVTGSIKENTSTTNSCTGCRQVQPDGRVVYINYPLRDLIATAYEPGPRRTIAAPEWDSVLSARFDIEATAPGNPPTGRELYTSGNRVLPMLQSLLADRFKLSMHFETRPIPVYTLMLSNPGRTGPRLTPHSDDIECIPAGSEQRGFGGFPTPWCGGIRMSPVPGGFRELGNKISVDTFVQRLMTMKVDRLVLDRTGLTGLLDWDLEYSRPMGWLSEFAGGATPPGQSPLPPIATALQEQLGLTLQPATEPTYVLVIDHVEKPTEGNF